MMSWNGNASCITGSLCGNPLVTCGFPSQRASNAELWCFPFCQHQQGTGHISMVSINKRRLYVVILFSWAKILFLMIWAKCQPMSEDEVVRCNIMKSWKILESSELTANLTHLTTSATYIRQWVRSALVPIMACRLFSIKPLSGTMLEYC